MLSHVDIIACLYYYYDVTSACTHFQFYNTPRATRIIPIPSSSHTHSHTHSHFLPNPPRQIVTVFETQKTDLGLEPLAILICLHVAEILFGDRELGYERVQPIPNGLQPLGNAAFEGMETDSRGNNTGIRVSTQIVDVGGEDLGDLEGMLINLMGNSDTGNYNTY
jgi:hypothetical protein